MNEKLLQDKVCMITGGGRGLGAAIAEKFLQAGAMVAILDVDAGAVESAARTLDPSGEKVFGCRADVTDEDEILSRIDEIMKRFRRIDILVNSAGLLGNLPIDKLSVADFERVIKVNLTGTFIVCKSVIPVMKIQGAGKIINIASLGGRTGRPGVGVNYAASKAGVIGLTQTLARELGSYGIYANAIAPGPIMTEMTLQAPKEMFEKWRAGRAVNRDGEPRDVANTALFLASDMSDWVTGITLDVNGGILIR